MPAPTPKEEIDWKTLSLDLAMNSHVEVRHHRSTDQWTSPTLIENSNISISGLSPGLNYGQQCYEGLKAFRTPDGRITVFRPYFHAKRMSWSAEAVSLPPPSEELFVESVRQAVAANAEFVPPSDGDAYLYIRPVLLGASANLMLAPPEETILAVYVQPIQPYHGSAAVDGLVLEDFDRAAPRGTGAYKVGGNYAPVWRHMARASKLGYGLTLHLDSATRTYVEEFSTSGFLGHQTVDGRHVLVVPKTNSAIASATSDSLVKLAEKAGWLIDIKEVPFSSMSALSEVVAVGTAASAVPVRSLSRLSTQEKYQFGTTERGPLIELAAQMAKIQRGRLDDSEGWCHEIVDLAW